MTSKRVQVEKAYDEPFVLVPNADAIELMQRVKPTAVCVYLAILTHANRKAGNTAYPGTALIAKEANVSRRTVVSAVQELQEAGILTVTPRFNEKNGQITSLYRLHRISAPCADSAYPPVQDLHTPYANNDTTPVQNLHTNQMNKEPDEEEPEFEAQAPSKPKTKRATQVPDEFPIDERWIAWGNDNGFTVDDMRSQVPQFQDHYRSKGEPRKDWDATFRTWMRNAKKWGHLAPKNTNVTPFQNSNRKQDGWSAYDIAAYATELERQGQ